MVGGGAGGSTGSPDESKCSFAVSGFPFAKIKKAIPRVRGKDDVDRNY